MYLCLALLAVISTSTKPGTVITLSAWSNYSPPVEARLVVVSPLFDRLDPVYVPARTRATRLRDGGTVTYTDHSCDGLRVVVPIYTEQGFVGIICGIQLANGNIWVDGKEVSPCIR